MDAAPPPAVIEIQKTERHSIRAELVEHVARLLCRADGKEPDQDYRLSSDGGTFHTVHVPYPMYLLWYGYKEKAEALIRQEFK